MKSIMLALILFTATTALANDNIIYDDGTGAQMSFFLSVHEQIDGQDVTFTTFRLIVRQDGKFLLFTDLPGALTDDGKTFSGKIIIPSGMIQSAEIIMLGAHPHPMSSRAFEKKIKVAEFKKVLRKKSWTEQE